MEPDLDDDENSEETYEDAPARPRPSMPRPPSASGRLRDDEDEDEDDDNQVQPHDPGMTTVYMEIRSRGTRGPANKNGGRGRVILEGPVKQQTVDDLKGMMLGKEAALCEPLSIWVAEVNGEKTKVVRSTGQSPAQVNAQVAAATVEHEREMEALAASLRGARSDVQNAELKLEILQRNIQLAEATLERLRLEREDLRACLELDRKRADDEREALKADRALRLQERQLVIQQDAMERQGLLEFAKQSRTQIQVGTDSLAKLMGGLTHQLSEHVSAQMKSDQEMMTQVRGGTAALLAQERAVQESVQNSKMHVVAGAVDLKNMMDTMAPPPAPPAGCMRARSCRAVTRIAGVATRRGRSATARRHRGRRSVQRRSPRASRRSAQGMTTRARSSPAAPSSAGARIRSVRSASRARRPRAFRRSMSCSPRPDQLLASVRQSASRHHRCMQNADTLANLRLRPLAPRRSRARPAAAADEDRRRSG